MSGAFITFEGGEGSGKSTQLAMLEVALNKAHIPYLKTREPGGSKNAERIRALLVSGDHAPWDPVAETLLFYADRIEHVNTIVKPALAAGKIVICDRFADSTLVYQGIGKGVSMEFIQNLHRLSLGDFAPDLTIILDIDPATGLTRAAERKNSDTRFEKLPLDFHHKVRDGFLALAKREPKRCTVIDASQDASGIHAKIIAALKERLGVLLG